MVRTTPGVALDIADRVWTIGDFIEATLALEPNRPIRTKRNFTVTNGGKEMNPDTKVNKKSLDMGSNRPSL
jgi:hypothetical protein